MRCFLLCLTVMVATFSAYSVQAEEQLAYIQSAKTWQCGMAHCPVYEKPGRCACGMQLKPHEIAYFVPVTWKCGMAECKVQEKPGRCPQCGMNLRPATVVEVLTWKCPMEQCKVTGQAKFGRCTVCGMNLVHETLGRPIPADDIIRSAIQPAGRTPQAPTTNGTQPDTCCTM